MKGVPVISKTSVVHVVAHGIFAFRYQLQGLFAHHAASVRLVVIDGIEHRPFAESVEHFQEAFLGPTRGGHQSTRITFQQIRVARVAENNAVGFVVQSACVNDFDWRNEGAVMKYFCVGRSDASRP